MVENYQPISLTSHVIEKFEHIVRMNVVDYLESKNIIISSQHDFRSGLGTELLHAAYWTTWTTSLRAFKIAKKSM